MSAPERLPYLTVSDLRPVLAKVSQQFEKAVREGDAFFFESSIRTLRVGGDGGEGRIGDEQDVVGRVPFQIRLVPALLKKPTSNAASNGDGGSNAQADGTAATKPPSSEGKGATEGRKQNEKDPFAPPYVPNLLVQELGDYVVLLNKYCVVANHFLLVTKEFAPQHLPPSPRMLALIYRILQAHAASGADSKELLAFYNCGPQSGASQPHQHAQFIEVGHEKEQGGEPTKSKVPIEAMLEGLEDDGRIGEYTIHGLNVPWQQYVALLTPPPGASSKPEAGKPDPLENYLAGRFLTLLDTMVSAKRAAAAAPTGSGAEAEWGRERETSFNLLVTRRAMHLIPRGRETFDGLPGRQDGGEIGALSINALGFAGLLLVKSEAELSALERLPGGVAEVLSAVGVPRTAEVEWAQELVRDEKM